MTEASFDFIIEQVKNMKVEAPVLLTMHELSMWTIGYSACQEALIQYLSKMKNAITVNL